MLQANPDINVLWAANEGGTVAHANAVKTLGLGGKVAVFGTDMNNQMGQMLQASDNILQGVTGQAPYQMGYDALDCGAGRAGRQEGRSRHQHADDLLRPRQRRLDQASSWTPKAMPSSKCPPHRSSQAPAAGKPLIAGVVFQSDTFMQTVQAGMQAAADKTRR